MPAKSRARKRGFAAMKPELQREISRRGGEASHQSGRGHEFSPEEAREAGRRGGEARWGHARELEEERSDLSERDLESRREAGEDDRADASR